MHKNIFDQTATDLREMGYPALSTPLLEGNNIYQLTASLPQISPLQIVCFFLNDLLQLGASEETEPEMDEMASPTGVDFLQLFISFPFEFANETIPDLARLMNMINWTTPVGTFGINELQKIIYYRHVLEWRDEQTDNRLILDAVSGMEYYAAFRYKRIQAFAAGEITMSGLLQELNATNTLNEEFPGYDLRNQ